MNYKAVASISFVIAIGNIECGSSFAGMPTVREIPARMGMESPEQKSFAFVDLKKRPKEAVFKALEMATFL